MSGHARTVTGYRHTGQDASRWGGQGLALAALCTLLFLTFLDNTVVSVAPATTARQTKRNSRR